MKGIIFGSLHSYRDLRLILESKEMGAPTVKVNKIDIPGADSALDLTDYFGKPTYEDVKHKFTFTSIEPQETFLSQFSQIKNAIHGKKVRIILDDDPSFFYMGRCFVSSFTNANGIGTVSVECECEPYKYKVDKTVHAVNLSGKNIFDCQNPNVLFRSAASHSSLETGIRVTILQKAPYMYACFKIVPAKLVVGSKITASWKTQAEAAGRYIVVMGYANSVEDFKKVTETSLASTLTMTVEESYASLYNYVAIWLYANRAEPLDAGEYVDYTDVQIEISATATAYEPYVNTSNTIIELVPGSRKAVIPVLYSSKPITVTHNGYTVAMAAETEYIVPEFELKEGDNEFTITGSGVASFKYQEGSL